MAYFEGPYQHFGGEHQVFVASTLPSIYNEAPTGCSPGPLSTPSPASRNASQGPEQIPEFAEQMVYDDGCGNFSDSPTSVRTPDDDMLDSPMLDLYQPQHAGMTTRVSQSGLPALETGMMLSEPGIFSDQVLQDVYSAALASQSQQYPAQFAMQTRPLSNTLPAQPYNDYFGQNYHNQPPRQDPWSGQGPPRNSAVPRSGMAVFDPVTDPVSPQIDYSAFIDNWALNNTDPNYLLSPSDAVAPPPEFFPAAQHSYFAASQQPPQQHQTFVQPRSQEPMQSSSPIEMRVTTASPAPDASNFVNYTSASQLFTSNYITDAAPPSLVPSIEPGANSPLTSASSPGGSETVLSSYQHSESSGNLDRSLDQLDTQFLPPPSPVRPSPVRPSPNRSILEGFIDISPEPEQPQPQPARRSGAKGAGRPGGRTLGTHLPAKVAKAAHDMRKTVACWHCVLQRDRCGPGDICDRCEKRSQRPNADCGLGCSRIKLIELAQYFLPSLIMQIHEDTHLTHFVTQFIHQWNNQEITLYMTCSQKKMPRIPVKVYEFAPRGKELLEQIQYQTDRKTNQRIAQKKMSPPLGMVHINHNEEKKYDKYINDIVDNHLDAFSEVCWADDDNDFAPRLFRLLTRVNPKNEDEQKLLREVFRLVVCTYIMSHTLTIAEETKIQTLSRMHSYTHPGIYVQNFTSPRMTNRQLKYFFARIQRSITNAVLNKLQQIFKSSKGCDKWVSAFVAVTGMALAYEDQQKTIHQVMETRAKTERWDPRDAQAQADIACREIDTRMNFISQIFRWKYNRKLNPLRDAGYNWEKEAGFGDEKSVNFVRSVAQLVKENIDYLQYRQNVSISPTNQAKYTARLAGQFMLSFWLPG